MARNVGVESTSTQARHWQGWFKTIGIKISVDCIGRPCCWVSFMALRGNTECLVSRLEIELLKSGDEFEGPKGSRGSLHASSAGWHSSTVTHRIWPPMPPLLETQPRAREGALEGKESAPRNVSVVIFSPPTHATLPLCKHVNNRRRHHHRHHSDGSPKYPRSAARFQCPWPVSDFCWQ